MAAKVAIVPDGTKVTGVTTSLCFRVLVFLLGFGSLALLWLFLYRPLAPDNKTVEFLFQPAYHEYHDYRYSTILYNLVPNPQQQVVQSFTTKTTTATPIIETPLPPMTEEQYFSRRAEKTYDAHKPFLEPGKLICTDKTHIVILVQASATNQDLRMTIRQTWGAFSRTQQWPRTDFLSKEVRMGFIFGTSTADEVTQLVLEESRIHKDVIVADFVDSYRNLTRKTLASMEWVRDYCPSAKYFIKCDDDTILNVDNLVKFLEVNPIDHGIAGALGIVMTVRRDGSKWSVTKREYPFDYYPPYYSGPAYVMHTNLLVPMLNEAEYIPLVPIEDAYITGVLGKIVQVKRYSPGGFATTGAWPPKACDMMADNFYSGTNIKRSEDLAYLWSRFESGNQCDENENSVDPR